MSVVIPIRHVCDECEVSHETTATLGFKERRMPEPGVPIIEVFATSFLTLAAPDGWTAHDGAHFCPLCSEKRDVK